MQDNGNGDADADARVRALVLAAHPTGMPVGVPAVTAADLRARPRRPRRRRVWSLLW
ncbi:hypothetical protein RB614_09095 [Phytohabitans sp. ZYX-F-186]|uniref:Uncharacterized protein n=1 Tax=Phytohabitans maris TaxID=3071409 RepID=A0ABU0ZC92_9ACTN|nr:hypothetical protein [Phytohabitans sp. ZYX-F-186]MDQ7904675.1 hypothetical protein [Phytohabitans sp. ZYX-F-186]